MLEMDGVMNKKTEMKALPPSTTAGNANEDEDYMIRLIRVCCGSYTIIT